MIYYLALCSGLIIGQIYSLTLNHIIILLFNSFGLFSLAKWLKFTINCKAITLVLTIISIIGLSVSYSSFRNNIRVENQVTVPITKLSTSGYLTSPIKQNTSSNQVNIKITNGSLNGKILTLNYQKDITLKPATEYKFTINIYPLNKTNNIDGFNLENYYLANNISATAQLIDRQELKPNQSITATINAIRSNLIAYLRTTTSDYKYSGFFIALATGYQSDIPKAQWDMFQRTGINHIVSISGLHLTLVTGFFMLLVSMILKRVKPTRVPHQIIIGFSAIIFAIFYALLAGFGIPIQRALYLLTISFYLTINRKYLPILYQLVICLTTSLLIDPFAIFSIGFWFSYVLIAGIMLNITQRDTQSNKYKIALRMQLVIVLLGIPLSLYYFSKVSLISAIANLWAVPILGTIFTPTVLITAILHIDWLIKFVAQSLNCALYPIELFANVNMYSQIKPNLATVLLAYLGIVLFIVRLPIKYKNIFAAILIGSIFFTTNSKIKSGTAKITTFSNSNGVALIQTRDNNILYVDSESNSVEYALNSVIPNLQAQGINQIQYLVNNDKQNESIIDYLSRNHIRVLQTKLNNNYYNGVNFTRLNDLSIVLKTKTEITYIGDCSKSEEINNQKLDNIIIPSVNKNCDWIYNTKANNLIINGNNKSQSKIERFMSNLNLDAQLQQNISNATSNTLIVK